jgi:uridine phosphorylase
MKAEYPLLEFDGESTAIFEPSQVYRRIDGIPESCVLPMYHTVIARLKEKNLLDPVVNIGTPLGPMPVYRMTHAGVEVTVAHPGLCAPMAAAIFEELIAYGCRKFIACGSCGVLDGSLPLDTVVVPTGAVRDEGTSYHYLAPSREIAAQPEVVHVIETVLKDHEVPYRLAKTWTTDAIYRETSTRIARRKSEGCLTVEMECAAFLAVAAYRNVQFGQLLAPSDDVSGDKCLPRLGKDYASFAERVFWLAVEACTRL